MFVLIPVRLVQCCQTSYLIHSESIRCHCWQCLIPSTFQVSLNIKGPNLYLSERTRFQTGNRSISQFRGNSVVANPVQFHKVKWVVWLISMYVTILYFCMCYIKTSNSNSTESNKRICHCSVLSPIMISLCDGKKAPVTPYVIIQRINQHKSLITIVTLIILK